MSIFKELTPEEKKVALEKKAEKDSEFLADDIMVSLENYGKEYEVSEILDTDNFKKFLSNNVKWVWENELSDNEKRFYYQQLCLFISTQQEQQDYFNRLFVLAADHVMKRFTDYIGKHNDVVKVVVKSRRINFKTQ